MNFLDADVSIDILRKEPSALEWVRSITEKMALPGFVALELIIGCQNRRELKQVREFLEEFTLVWASDEAMLSALTEIAPLKLSCGIGSLDCLIAATVMEQGGTLYTFNARHFRRVSGLQFANPYPRRSPLRLEQIRKQNSIVTLFLRQLGQGFEKNTF